jgi:hypothetical protein
MARRAEFVALDLEDFTLWPDGTGRVLIRRSKTDQAGEGNRAYLARETVCLLLIWLERAKITAGAVFRRLVGRSQIGERLNVDAIWRTCTGGARGHAESRQRARKGFRRSGSIILANRESPNIARILPWGL